MSKNIKLYIRKFVSFLFIGSMLIASLVSLTGCSDSENSKETESPQKVFADMITAWKCKDEETFKNCFTNPDEIIMNYQFIDANPDGDENLIKTSDRIQKEIYSSFTYDITDFAVNESQQTAAAYFTISTIDMEYFLARYLEKVKDTEFDISNGSGYLIKSKLNEEIYANIEDYIKSYNKTITVTMVNDGQWKIYNGDEILNVLTGGYLGG